MGIPYFRSISGLCMLNVIYTEDPAPLIPEIFINPRPGPVHGPVPGPVEALLGVELMSHFGRQSSVKQKFRRCTKWLSLKLGKLFKSKH